MQGLWLFQYIVSDKRLQVCDKRLQVCDYVPDQYWLNGCFFLNRKTDIGWEKKFIHWFD